MGTDDGFGRREPRLSRHANLGKRPRTLVAAFLGTFVCFLFFVHHYAQTNGSDSDTVWIWFGMRSDGRCGRDFGTDYVKETKCGGEGCCSSHGWCGNGEEYCSVALGCQSGCWPDERTEEQKAEAAEGGQPRRRRPRRPPRRVRPPRIPRRRVRRARRRPSPARRRPAAAGPERPLLFPARSDDYPRHHEYHEGGHGGYHDRYHDHHAYDDYHHRYDELTTGSIGWTTRRGCSAAGRRGGLRRRRRRPEVVSMHEDKHLGEGTHAEFAENDEGPGHGHE